jgi:hypothetical protein
MAKNEPSPESLPAAKPQFMPGIPVKVAAIMAVGGGMLVGATCGWAGLLVGPVFFGIIGGIVGRVLTNRIALWSGFVITMIKATTGGGYVGLLLGIITGAITAGWDMVSNNHSIPSEFECFLTLFVIPIGTVAGMITGAMLWLDSSKQDC